MRFDSWMIVCLATMIEPRYLSATELRSSSLDPLRRHRLEPQVCAPQHPNVRASFGGIHLAGVWVPQCSHDAAFSDLSVRKSSALLGLVFLFVGMTNPSYATVDGQEIPDSGTSGGYDVGLDKRNFATRNGSEARLRRGFSA
jgi:hypothetical protein